jgi:hypothetical protein
MANFLDKVPPFDFSDPAARDLWTLLSTNYQSKPDVRDMLAQVRVDTAEIDWDNSMRGVWRDILTLTHRQARLLPLLEQIVGSGDEAIAARIKELMAASPALKLLPGDRQERFREALGLGHLDDLPVVTGDTVMRDSAQVNPERLVAPAPGAHHTGLIAFSPDIRDRYQPKIEAAGLLVPDRWDEAALLQLRHMHRGRDATADTLDALCLGIQALPVLMGIGGTDIAMRKLRYLYRRHLGRWPDAKSRHDILVQAAAATVAEWRGSDPGYSPEGLTALARFMLAVAGRWKAPAQVSLDDPGLRSLVDWLTGPLTQQREDLEDYLVEVRDRRTWALIELDAEESNERTRPTGVVVDLITERGMSHTSRIPCDTAQGVTAEESVKRALRQAIAELPDSDVLVDLYLPRHWLDAGVERWDVVKVLRDRYESMSRHYGPRLRWAMHRHEIKLRDRQVKRFKAVNWAAQPEAIPQSVTSDPEQLRDWLDRRDVKGIRLPPYLCAVQPTSGEHDPLGTLLWEGYGLAVWFGPDAEAAACASAACLAEGMAAAERLDELPAVLAEKLRAYRPVIIWNDPEGRADFKLPDPRRGGTLRGSID